MTADQMISTYFETGTLPNLPRNHFIDGAFIPAVSGNRMESIDAGTGAPFADYAAGTAPDVDHAVASAVKGFALWRDTPPARRCSILNEAARLMRAEADRLAVVESLDSGKTLAEARSDVAGSGALPP